MIFGYRSSPIFQGSKSVPGRLGGTNSNMSKIAANGVAVARFLFYSSVGAVAFFVPLTINGRSTIVMDHIITYVSTAFTALSNLYCVTIIVAGVVSPFVRRAWKHSRTDALLSLLQITAIPLAAMYLLDRGPEAIMQPDMLPFLFERLAVPVGLIIPVGALFLTCLIGFGLLEATGTLMEPIMRPIWKTPGRSAIDAVASFAGSYSVGLLLTSRVYKAGRYSAKEAAIIATGFSTVSTTFMVVVAKTLSLTSYWNAYFWSTLFVTFFVTAITVRLPPLSTFNNSKPIDDNSSEVIDSNRSTLLGRAWQEALMVARSADPVGPMLWRNLIEGLQMAMRVVPSILSIGMIGLLVAKHTPMFDILGIVIFPVVWLSQLPNPAEISGALSSGLAEMFLPAIQSTDMPSVARFTVGIVSVSSILFFSASIPCVLATGIPITIWHMIVIWLERTILSVPVAAVLGYVITG
jgi:nucleoside recognition membrane protein YjiH